MFNLNLVIMRGSDQELFVVITDKTTEEFADEFPELPEFDEPWDEMLSQQELENFEQCDEYFGFYGGDEDW